MMGAGVLPGDGEVFFCFILHKSEQVDPDNFSWEIQEQWGVWLWRKGNPGLRWDVLLRKLKKNWSRGEHFQVDSYFMQLFKILSKVRQECNLLNIRSGGRSSLQQPKRKILWNRWQKIRTNPEVSITLPLFLSWKFHINHPGSNICMTVCSYLTQCSHSFFSLKCLWKVSKRGE